MTRLHTSGIWLDELLVCCLCLDDVFDFAHCIPLVILGVHCLRAVDHWLPLLWICARFWTQTQTSLTFVLPFGSWSHSVHTPKRCCGSP